MLTVRCLLLAVCLLAGFLPVASVHAQSTPPSAGNASSLWTLQAGLGAMMVPSEDRGNAVSVEVGRRFQTGFVGTLGVTRGRTAGRYPALDMLFADSPYDVSHTTVHLGFSYPIPVYGRHVLALGTGAAYTRQRIVLAYADLWVDEASSETRIAELGMETIQDVNAGMLLSSAYLYRRDRFDVGVRAQGVLLYDVGIGSVVVGPVIGVRF